MIRTGEAASAVVTGIGVLAATGSDTESHWQSVLDGRTRIGPISRFDPSTYPVRLSGELHGFSAKHSVPSRLIPQTDRWSQIALAATDLALGDAKVDTTAIPEYEMAVVTSSSSGGTEFGQHEMERLYQHGPDWVSAYQSIAWFYAATTGQVSIHHEMRGPCGVICTEQAGGLDALAQACRLIRHGESRLVVSGGTDASLCPYGLTAQLSTGLMSTKDDPSTAYRPFDVCASGYVPGEGGAILIVESAESAISRPGAEVYGTVLGHASGFDPPPGSERPPALRATIRNALRAAGVRADEVDVVFADAMGVPELDVAEAAAITSVFGAHEVPVTAPKTMTGRLYGGGAALDVATALLALRNGIIPPTAGTTEVAERCEIDLVMGQARGRQLRTALVLARGYGGFTSATVIGAPPDAAGSR